MIGTDKLEVKKSTLKVPLSPVQKMTKYCPKVERNPDNYYFQVSCKQAEVENITLYFHTQEAKDGKQVIVNRGLNPTSLACSQDLLDFPGLPVLLLV